MQLGLNIGIGSWIDSRQRSGTQPALPNSAIPFSLRHFGDVRTPRQAIQASELSLYANELNFGTTWTTGIRNYLWDRHKQIIEDMTPAISTLTQQERVELNSANAILFATDGFSMSPKYVMYEEYKRIHEDLVAQNARPDETSLAYQNWTVFGHKAEVEGAVATKVRLSGKSSHVVGSEDIARIDIALETLGGDVPFVPTLFSPLSATSPTHWTEAEVDFQALEDSIHPKTSRTPWKRFRANKNGSVRFRFASVELHRPWFSTSVYEGDDWRLDASGTEATFVSSGDGKSGRLPSFYSRIYLAQILNIRRSNKKQNGGQLPGINPVRPVVARPLNIQAARRGVVPTSVARPARLNSTLSPARPTSNRITTRLKPRSPVRPTLRLDQRLNGTSQITIGSHGRMESIQKLTVELATNKVSFAQAQLISPTLHATRPEATYLVGFGRSKLPPSPQPNPNHQWP